MITLPDKIKNDLSSSAYQLQYLLEIQTTPPILIGTRKENLKVLQGYDDFVDSYELGEDFLEPMWYDYWSGGYQAGGILVIETISCYRNIDTDYANQSIQVGKTYLIELEAEFLSSPGVVFLSTAAEQSAPINNGFNSIEITVNSYTTDKIGFQDCSGTLIHGLSIKEKSFIGGTSPIYNYTYYEDANMKVSNLKEKIDLKTKKIQYSDLTFTLSNLEGVDGKLIDKLDNIYGADINLYAITQSCDLIGDRLPIAKLKATRMENDNTSIKITANDRNLEGFYVKLPQTLLEKDVNTYEAYNLKPVPILYGHLKNAPAAVYYDGTNEPRLLVDDSYDDDEKEIEGIKQYNILKQDNLSSDPVDEWQDEMISPNCVRVQLGGDSIVDVVCRPYVNARDEIIETHNYPQYETHHDYVQLHKKYGDISTLLDGVNVLWCSHISKATKDSNSSYEYHRFGSFYDSHYEGTGIYGTMSVKSIFYDISEWNTYDINYRYRAGIETWSFEEVSGDSVYTSEDNEEIVDVNFIGNVYINLFGNPDSLPNTGNVRIFGHYSPYRHDPDQDMNQEYATHSIPDSDPPEIVFDYDMGDVHSSGYGSPEEYLSGVSLDFDGDFDYLRYTDGFWMMQRQAFYGKAELPKQYASYLTQGLHDPSDGSYWKAHYGNLISGLHKGMSAGTLTLYYMVEPQFTELAETPTTSIQIAPTWTDLQIRKTWTNENIFENIFYVNARGRVDKDIELSNTYKIKAKIKVLTEEDLTEDNDQDRFAYEHKHHLELYKILTDGNFSSKIIDGDIYDLMIKFENAYGIHYMWDIDLNNIFFSNDWGDETGDGFELTFFDDGSSRSDTRGWVYDITARAYTDRDDGIFGNAHGSIYGLPGFKLVYGKINWDNQSDIESIYIASDDNSEELSEFNILNKAPIDNIEGNNIHYTLSSFFGCSRIFWLPEDVEEGLYKPIDNGAEILKNLVNTEMGVDVTLDEEKYIDSINALGNSKMSFSINEQKKSQEILEDICSQSRLTFRYRPRDASIVIGNIKNGYDEDVFDKELNIEDMLSYKYSKTKIEDLCIGGCSVKWGWNYEKGENVSITSEINLSEVFLSQYKLFYGIIEEDNYKLELEAPYINDEASAIDFRNFMFNYYKNQHTTLKCSLTMQKGFELEAGDILKINSTNKVYGALLQDGKDIIDQGAYPLFYITSLTKYLDKVDMECVQLHNLSLEGIEDHVEETDI